MSIAQDVYTVIAENETWEDRAAEITKLIQKEPERVHNIESHIYFALQVVDALAWQQAADNMTRQSENMGKSGRILIKLLTMD